MMSVHRSLRTRQRLRISMRQMSAHASASPASGEVSQALARLMHRLSNLTGMAPSKIETPLILTTSLFKWISIRMLSSQKSF